MKNDVCAAFDPLAFRDLIPMWTLCRRLEAKLHISHRLRNTQLKENSSKIVLLVESHLLYVIYSNVIQHYSK